MDGLLQPDERARVPDDSAILGNAIGHAVSFAITDAAAGRNLSQHVPDFHPGCSVCDAERYRRADRLPYYCNPLSVTDY